MTQNSDNTGIPLSTGNGTNGEHVQIGVDDMDVVIASIPSSQAIVITPELMSKLIESSPSAVSAPSCNEVASSSVLMDIPNECEMSSTLRLNDMPLDGQALELDSDICVEDLSQLMEVDGADVGPDDFIVRNPESSATSDATLDSASKSDSMSSTVQHLIDTTDITAPIFDPINCQQMDCPDLNPTVAVPMLPPQIDEQNRGSSPLVHVTTRTSLLTKQSFSLEMPVTVVRNVTDTENYLVVSITDQGPGDTTVRPPDKQHSILSATADGKFQLQGSDMTDQTNSFACAECGFVSPSGVAHKQHVQSHCEEKPYKCELEGCSWSFPSQWRLNRHQRIHGALSKSIPCTVDGCKRKFTSSHNLKAHLKTFHDKSKERILCNVDGCNMGFKFVKQLLQHVDKLHPDAPKLQCPIPECSSTFVLQSQLEKHLESHSKRQSFVCEKCGKDMKWQSRYNEHMDIHNNIRRHQCMFEDCGMTFATSSRLRRHEKTHTEFRPYQCDYEGCSKAFYRKEHLTGHINTEHKQLKPYECPIENCQSKFSSKCGMSAHVKKHYTQGAKSVRNCPLPGCRKQCPSKASFNQHIHNHLSHSDHTGVDGFMSILEKSNLLPEEKLSEMRQAMSTFSSQPVSIMESLYFTLQRYDVGNPFLFVQEAAYKAAEEVVVSAESHAEPPEKYLTDPEAIRAWEALKSRTTDESPEKYLRTEFQPTAGTSKDDVTAPRLSTDPLCADVELGAARTDYIVNYLLSEHARCRLALFKQGAKLDGIVSLQDIVKLRTVQQTDVSGDSDSDEFCYADNIGEGFDPSEMLKSPTSMTLKDPETGATYVQTQLLQDDPPGSLN